MLHINTLLITLSETFSVFNFKALESRVMPLLIKPGIAKELCSLTFILIILFHILPTEICLLIVLQRFWQQGFLDLLITF